MRKLFLTWRRVVEYLETEDDQFAKIKSRVDRFEDDGFDEDEAAEAGWMDSLPVIRRVIETNIGQIEDSAEESDGDDME